MLTQERKEAEHLGEGVFVAIASIGVVLSAVSLFAGAVVFVPLLMTVAPGLILGWVLVHQHYRDRQGIERHLDDEGES